ncbi:MAG TPA: substrate-binding domain-containing protein [Amycolatopsis sp.]|nr:substrate-binding domain-containing protein [Amycolatopsis sp.]
MLGTALAIALVFPLHGPGGVFGPSCELCAQLAVDELNTAGGVLGRELTLVPVDGGGAPAGVAAEVGALVSTGAVSAVIGWHTSAVRQELVRSIAGRVPYVYTALYEGGERAPGVFVTGETPSAQLFPGMSLFARELGARRWFVVGNDYVWPRQTARQARSYVRALGGRIDGERYVPLDTEDFGPVLREIARHEPDAVLMLLVGNDAVRFNRAFAASGLDRECRRLTTLMDENMLLATGVSGTRRLFAASGYFETLVTAENLEFAGRYARRFGVTAPAVGNLGESCYEGVRLLAALLTRAGSAEVGAVAAIADEVCYEGPRGRLRLRDGHVSQRIYLAEADALEFSVVTQL